MKHISTRKQLPSADDGSMGSSSTLADMVINIVINASHREAIILEVKRCNLEWFIQVRERLQDGLVLEARRVALAR